MSIKFKGNKGQVLPLALIAMAGGALIIGPLMTYVSTSLYSLQKGTASVREYYAADSGAEHAIWRLKYDGLSLSMETPFNYIYSTVNNLPVDITITKKATVTSSLCGDNLPGSDSDKVEISKSVTPEHATPGVPTVFNYQIEFENQGTSTIHFSEIGYTLPVGFIYIAGSSVGNYSDPPNYSDPTINGRILTWDFSPPYPSIGSGDEFDQTFRATGVLDDGTYCDLCDAAWVVFTPASIGCVMSSGGGDRYNIRSAAGSNYVQSAIGISEGDVTILSWDTR